MAAHGLDDVVVARDGAGVRSGGTAASFGGTDFQYHQRLFKFGRFLRKAAEFFTAFDAFNREQHDICCFRMQHETREIHRIDIGLVATTRFIADAEAVFHRAPHHIDLAEPAAMAHHADIARRRILPSDRGGGSHREPVDEIHHAVAVGPHKAYARFTAKFDQALLTFASLRRAALGKTAAEYGDKAHTDGRAVRQHIEHALARHHDADVIRRFRQIPDARIALEAVYFLESRIYRVDGPAVAEAGHLLEHTPAK